MFVLDPQFCRRKRPFLALLTTELQANVLWNSLVSGKECKSDIPFSIPLYRLELRSLNLSLLLTLF